MRRVRTRFVCQKCGHETPRWLGRCPDCGEWNTLLEEPVAAAPATTGSASGSAAEPRPITAVTMEAWSRTRTGLGELDRVLGGGTVPGSLVLVGGDPGIGKSTLLLQAAARLAEGAGTALYVTGEESLQQVRLRAERLEALAERLYLLAETDAEQIERHVRALRPRFLIADSIQTLVDPELGSAPGTVSQVRGCCARLAALARSTQLCCFIVGHVTKEGTLAGPRVLEHMVDTVLYFEGERFQAYRVLRAVKNRFGSTDEIGVFEMGDAGLREVAAASELFLEQRATAAPGSAIGAVLEGTRPLLVECQALVARSHLAAPRRTTTGVDANRTAMLLAVLERRCGLRMADRDVYASVAGGLRVAEPALDLPLALALASSRTDRPVDPAAAFVGEVGLAGEVRAVRQVLRRAREAARMGFIRLFCPPGTLAGGERPPAGLELVEVTSLAEAIALGLTESAGASGGSRDACASADGEGDS